MKKTIVIAMMALLVSMMSASAYHTSYGAYGNVDDLNRRNTLRNIPNVNPAYGAYVDVNSYLRENKFRNAVKRFRYQQATSPYIMVRAPYGADWEENYRPYGDQPHRATTKQSRNPFYGFKGYRNYHCHDNGLCHYHNKFPRTR